MSLLERQVLDVAARFGFQQILPPALEFEDVLAIGMGERLHGSTFRFDDWHSGRMLAIPPDITPQIARIVATRFKGLPLPYRLSYSGRVLRHTEPQSGRSREIMQAGVELIGSASPESDAEMVAMAAQAVSATGLTKFTIDLGQVAFCKGIFAASCLTGERLRQMQQAVALKDISSVRELLQGGAVPDSASAELLALPRLFGGCEVLEEARRVVKNRVSVEALENICQVVDLLSIYNLSDSLTIDLGETRGLDYHTGLIFEGFAPGMGEALFSGGRYDQLLGRYGDELPATGFTCNLFSLLEAVEQLHPYHPDQRDLLLLDLASTPDTAINISGRLRSNGYMVEQDIIRPAVDCSLKYAVETGIRMLLVVDDATVSDGLLQLIDPLDRVEKKLSLEQLWQQYPAMAI